MGSWQERLAPLPIGKVYARTLVLESLSHFSLGQFTIQLKVLHCTAFLVDRLVGINAVRTHVLGMKQYTNTK